MSATAAPVRRAPGVRRVHVTPPLSFVRLLGIEVRRSPMPLILPLIAVLFWFDSYRPSASVLPHLYVSVMFWNMGQGHTIVDFGPFVAGMTAWIGSREGRRGTVDLVTATVRPRWIAQLASWAAAAIWAVGAYLIFTGVMLGVYVGHGIKGEPPWWWIAVGAVAVATFTAVGFSVGALFPNRSIAPLAAFGAFLALLISAQTGFHDATGWAQILPTNSNGNFQQDSGIFYPFLPDLPIARMMLFAGIAAAFLGLLGLRATVGSRQLRLVAAVVTVCGAVAAGTAVHLASTSRLTPDGMEIPALHDAASDRPTAYAPDCTGSPFRVCVNPAYSSYLTDLAGALGPVIAETAGLPGAPVSSRQIGAVYGPQYASASQKMTITGDPAVLSVPLGSYAFVQGGEPEAGFAQAMRGLYLFTFIGDSDGRGGQAQQAVRAAMLEVIGMPFAASTDARSASASGPVYDASLRLAAMPASARHAWLATHLAALRVGRLTLEQIP